MFDDIMLSMSPDVVYTTTFWDRIAWREHASANMPQSPVLGFEAFKRELFARMYGYSDKMEEVGARYAHIETLHSQIANLPEFRNLEMQVKGEPALAACATKVVCDCAKAMLENLQNAPTEEDDIYDNVLQSTQPESEMARSSTQDIVTKANATSGELSSEVVRATLREAIAGAAEEIKEIEAQCMLMGWNDQPGEHCDKMQADAAKRIAQRMRNDANLRSLLKAIGKMRGFMNRAVIESPDTSGQDIHDVCFGDDISKMLASEFVYMASNELKTVFLSKLLDKQLMQYELEPPTFDNGGGDVVIMIDASGSMRGHPEEWAKAFAVASIIALRKEKRNVVVGFFDTRLLGHWRNPDPNETMRIMEHGANGGTNYDGPLRELLARHSVSPDSDLLIITDGCCAFAQSTATLINNTFGRLFAVLVYGGTASAFENIASSVETHIAHLSGNVDNDDVVSLFKQLNWRK